MADLRRADVDPDQPLRLQVAAELAFPDGSMGASGLRKEAQKGRLVIERIAGKDYTTLREIEKMRGLCRVQRGPDSGSNLKSGETESFSVSRRGSSETERVKSGLAAFQSNAKKLKESLRSTSVANTPSQPSATVIPLKSQS